MLKRTQVRRHIDRVRQPASRACAIAIIALALLIADDPQAFSQALVKLISSITRALSLL